MRDYEDDEYEEEDSVVIDKSLLKDSRGRPLTQGLFLEVGYNTEFAIYTLKDEDFEYEDKTYLSLKRLYLEHADPTEYDFACTYLLGWDQWQRICANKIFTKVVESWRIELELKLRSQAFKDIMMQSQGDKGFQAAKWIADRGWDKRMVGRPSKDELEREKSIRDIIAAEYNEDVVRLKDVR
jgi:hypothetical protein